MNVDRVKQAIEDKGISITKLSEELGIGRKTWYRWIKGETEPSFKKIQKLCKILNISITEIED